MKATEVKPRFVLPSLVWLLLAVASFVAAFGVWQNQRLERLRPPPIVAPPATDPAGTNPAAAPATPPSQSPSPPPPAGASPAVVSAEGAASAPLRQLDPQAGRQVLRCISRGRVTYRDLNAGCPEGAAERVTVFPTEGVGRPQ